MSNTRKKRKEISTENSKRIPIGTSKKQLKKKLPFFTLDYPSTIPHETFKFLIHETRFNTKIQDWIGV